jgi:succinate dehydrogenase/fumarate reductase flavoprotein subunit
MPNGQFSGFGAAHDHSKGEYMIAKDRLLVIGGDAAGMSAASQARRRRPDLEIVAFERSPHTSYSA